MNDTTNRQQQQHPIEDDEETTSPNLVNPAGGIIATSRGAASTSNPSSQPSSSHNLADDDDDDDEEEEQVVTSTSNENCGPTQQYPYSHLHNFVTSPARITSSTGNDYSSSPIQQHNNSSTQGRDESVNALLSTSEEDDSSEQQQQQQQQVQQQSRLSREEEEEYGALNVAMPTTSAAAAAAKSANTTRSRSHEKKVDDTTASSYNHLTSTRRAETNTETRASAESSALRNMVARDSGNNLAESGSNTSAEHHPVNHVEKIILKLPKQNESQSAAPYQTRQQQQKELQQRQEQQQQQHFLDNDPSMSNSCSNSSTNSSITAEADTRKVEPLKINLHHGSQQQQHHHHHHHQFHQQKPPTPHSPSSSSSSTADTAAAAPHVVPKITIKPLFPPKSSAAEGSGSGGSASEMLSEAPIPKLTMSSEPHIVPKLTIRAAHEEGGCTHTSIVPKLTIKMSDTQTHTHSTLSSPSNAAGKLGNSAGEQQPPLPKLTIKTTLDGASGSSILSSSISPASTSSTSTNSNSSSSAASSPPQGTSSTSTASSKVTSKSTKGKDDPPPPPVVPKLTIKTSPSGSHVTSATTETSLGDAAPAATADKIPKFTIKTGQEHAVIITSSQQSIPKLTIKTKSLEIEESPTSAGGGDSTKETEKIPKLTIKSSSADSALPPPPPIPKLTISTPHSPKSHGGSSGGGGAASSLVVRQVQVVSSPASPKKNQSPDRVPKLMISRQEVTTATGNHGSGEHLNEKTVPKLTIKTTSSSASVSGDQGDDVRETSAKVPKLTIKTMPKKDVQSSEDSDDGTSVESAQSSPEISSEEKKQTNKTVPKLTITNLGSPTLRLKAVPSAEGHKKASSKSTTPASASEPSTNVVANGGESSSSQEFRGFTENTTDVERPETEAGDDVKTKSPLAEVPEPRRTSDDMDIDEGLQAHDPKIFKNITHFGAIRNGEAYGIHVDNNLEALPEQIAALKKTGEVVDTVDLTSSPSPGSSPAHFNYTDADPKLPEFLNSTPQSNALLLECLQRETSVIQTTASSRKEQNNSLLLSQLTAPSRYPPPPPLHPRPQGSPHPHLFNVAAAGAMNYPQLNERLLANGGAHAAAMQQFAAAAGGGPLLRPPMHTMAMAMLNNSSKPTTVIDSIEILDTPEGSPRSSQDDSQSVGEFPHRLYMAQAAAAAAAAEENMLHHHHHHNNNVMHHNAGNNSSALKRTAKEQHCNFTNDCLAFPPNKMRRTESMTPTMATLTILTNDNATNSATLITTSPTLIGDNHCIQSPKPQSSSNSNHRSRKQKHDNILDVPSDEMDQVNQNSSQQQSVSAPEVVTPTPPAPAPKKRGRPRRIRPEEQAATPTPPTPTVSTPSTPNLVNTAERRVQLLRKRLAIDMVSAEQPTKAIDGIVEPTTPIPAALEEGKIRRERAIRTTRRCGTPNTAEKQLQSPTKQRKQRSSLTTAQSATPTTANMTGNCDVAGGGPPGGVNNFNHFGGSNSSLSSACSSNSSYSTTLTTTATTATAFMGTAVNCNFASASAASPQIDLTMSSSSSSCSGGGTTSTLTTVVARSMLPPIKALSSTDPLPDVVFQSKDFSAIMLTPQLDNAAPSSPSSKDGRAAADSQEGDELGGSMESGSGDDSASLNSPRTTSGRGRGRGRGRGSRGGPRAHRLGRGASAVAKAIALSRPRCVGGLKHTPDPERMKGLITPSPQVFEEDTRMSADMSQTQMISEPPTPIRQPDFLATNEEESQSSIISNSSVSILDPNTIAAVQNGANPKRLKKKKMEVCAAEEAEFTVSSIAEYDWPPPKGCCPSKNRDTFMIQEQVANYLGIKSFKRKYPDLPRRQIDMEERNWLQEKGLVTERMCDLGITAVWASDILDIMYADFYEKYEEYKDYVRQKHVRDIETKQKSLGLTINGRGLQARDRAMLSASKWNAYFNKTRKDERSHCLDLQNLMVNVPLPANVPATTLMNRAIVDEISKASSDERIPEPPMLLKPQSLLRPTEIAAYYPVACVPGQYSSEFKKYNHLELRALPVNTVLDNPMEKEAPLTSTAEETDTNSEACEAKGDGSSSAKRLKIRRSRRARSERSSKFNRDSQSEKSRPLSIAGGGVSDLDSAADSFCESSSGSSSSTSSSSDSASTCTSSSDDDDDDEMESDSEALATCAVCLRTQNKNPKNMPELFINCFTCDRKVHPSCIEMPYRMVLRVRNYNWQCADCKCCIKCKRKQEPNKMLYCEQCDRGFHIYCLGVKSVPDGRWSCERCSVCLRCGATTPEGLPQQKQQLCSANGEKVKPIKHKKVKWINEYRIDNITKLREHCSMLCVPCGRSRTTAKRLQISGGNFSPTQQGNSSRNSSLSPGFCSSTTQQQQQQQQLHSPQIKAQHSPDSIASKSSENSSNSITPMNSNAIEAASSSPPPPPVVA